MNAHPETLTIGGVAAAAGVGVETIRFYQRKGLLGEPQRPAGGIRRYGPADVARVRFIKSAQRLGFSLDEVAGLLVLDDGAHCKEARALAETRLVDVQHKLADLRRVERVLKSLIGQCNTQRGRVSCPLISALRSG
ncbi:MAG: Hg(II)-responsive transcriptional regulator [Steroidobacteraceae bacterium]|jgi:MerR family mercuric resistance operon transcriptional regulator|nr:Hg(II)-responsive transcriptional regulator [Steroidobacteraceae bacterium]